MQRNIVRNRRLDQRTLAGVAAGAVASALHDLFCPVQSSPVEAEPITEAERGVLVAYRRQLFVTTGSPFTGGDENFLSILGK